MTLFLANSLVTKRGFNPHDQLVRYKWYGSEKDTCHQLGVVLTLVWPLVIH